MLNLAPRQDDSSMHLTLALDGEWSASRPGRLTTEKTDPGIQWTVGWVCPTVRTLCSYRFRESNHDFSVAQLVRNLVAIPALQKNLPQNRRASQASYHLLLVMLFFRNVGGLI
jgi:hypothetical protein